MAPLFGVALAHHELSFAALLAGKKLTASQNCATFNVVGQFTEDKLQPFLLYVDDNFHYMDPDERTGPARFDMAKEALKAARDIVDNCLTAMLKPGMSASELYDQYINFGEDPFVVSDAGTRIMFSAWDYAKVRSASLCTLSP